MSLLLVLAMPRGAVGSRGRRALERRLARVLGMDAGVVGELMAPAWRRDDGRLALRVAAFLAATAPLSPRLLPSAVRERVIRAFVWWLITWQPEDLRLPLAYAGYRRELGSRSCPGLLPS